ncbi:MAG: hypothetical protein KDC87_08160 [Planctomycetes bacterium]|nr:hypothetical protein [Planctomycetota bacterium]
MTTVLAMLGVEALAAPVPQPQAGAEKPAAAAQEHATSRKTDPVQTARRALALAVGKAHRENATQKIDRYRAELEVTELGRDKDNITISLEVAFGATIERRAGFTMPMIRYAVDERGKKLLRGRDELGYWHSIGAKVENLSDKEHQNDRELVEQHIELSKMLLELLDPGKFVGSLRGNSPVQDVKLTVPGGKQIDAQRLDGTLDRFPLYRGDQKIRDAKVWMEVWVDKASSRLRQVKVFPLASNGTPVFAQGELIVLADFVRKDKVLLPCSLYFYKLLIHDKASKEQRQPTVRVNLKKFELNPALTKEDFRRPKS